jgi:hypothetical protein
MRGAKANLVLQPKGLENVLAKANLVLQPKGLENVLAKANLKRDCFAIALNRKNSL